MTLVTTLYQQLRAAKEQLSILATLKLLLIQDNRNEPQLEVWLIGKAEAINCIGQYIEQHARYREANIAALNDDLIEAYAASQEGFYAFKKIVSVSVLEFCLEACKVWTESEERSQKESDADIIHGGPNTLPLVLAKTAERLFRKKSEA